MTREIKHFSSFEKYCRRLPDGCGKHQATENLVMEHLSDIYDEYKTLKDNCWTARYDDYIILDPIVDKCVFGLKAISECCESDG